MPRISEQSSPAQPKVSVLTATYNQEKFVARAIESVLMQEADFPVELVICEDCSTDSTRKIVQEYATRYPNVIRPIFRETNWGGAPNWNAALKTCRGEYVANLDGDDFWTDRLKLQLQVDFLDTHPGAALCHHRTTLCDQHENPIEECPPEKYRVEQCSTDLIVELNFIHTSSLIIRRDNLLDLPEGYWRLVAGDTALIVWAGRKGWIGYIDRNMSTYRRNESGMWTGATPAVRRAQCLGTVQFLIPHLEGQIRESWISSLFHFQWEDVWEKLETGSSLDIAQSIKRLLKSTWSYRRSRFLPELYHVLRAWTGRLRRRWIKSTVGDLRKDN